MELEKNIGKKIDIDNLIALCIIGEDYSDFCKELEVLIKSKRDRNLIYKMYRVMQGKFVIGNTKFKQFVEDHKDIIEKMKNNHSLFNMTVLKYDSKGMVCKDSNIDYFYNYISKNINYIDIIISVVKKIKDLGFKTIIISDCHYNKEYKLDSSFNCTFPFFENIEVVPTYDDSNITYKTNDTCYCMFLSTFGYGKNKHISEYGRTIELNSLVFDVNRLPKEISMESTFDKITKLAEERKKDYVGIRNVVDLSSSIDELLGQFKFTKDICEKIDNAYNKEEIDKILKELLNNITELSFVSSDYEQQVVNNSKEISDQIIKAKKLLIRKRYTE